MANLEPKRSPLQPASPEAGRANRITSAQSGALKVLSADQRAAYERDGFIALPGLIGSDWLKRLQQVTSKFVDQSRSLTQSTAVFDLEADHTSTHPRIRRLVSPADIDPTFWQFA
ncbi:MAG TPA: hypothetical protein EYQ54_20940, partial [Myxococcales bacterium]|nr:hypothetical protein [Myxococcales bacterium]